MKSLVLLYLVGLGFDLRSQTLEGFAKAYPIGTNKAVVLLNELHARVVPGKFRPLDPEAKTETIVVEKPDFGLTLSFHLVDKKVAAMQFTKTAVGRAVDPDEKLTPFGLVPEKELEPFRKGPKLKGFNALRMGRGNNPIEAPIEKREWSDGRVVVLLGDTLLGSEMWIVDENQFDPRNFFVKPTDEMKANMREKVERAKQLIKEMKSRFGTNVIS